MARLEDCWFCGSSDVSMHSRCADAISLLITYSEWYHAASQWHYYVHCVDCGARGPLEDPAVDAEQAWNGAMCD